MKNFKKTNIVIKPFIILNIIILLTNCKKMVEVSEPITGSNASIVYGNDATATSVLTGIYTKISQDGINGGIGSLSYITALSSDELVLFNGNTSIPLLGYYQNNLTSSTTGTFDYWGQCYPIIYIANSAIEGITASGTLTPSVKKQLLGEAKFIRAFCYFYLVNLYGDVPLVLTTDYTINAKLPRAPKSQVYQQIVSDLSDAKNLLSEDYVDAHLVSTPDERVSPSKWSASAMLSRTYLYSGDYPKAESEASIVINNTSLFDMVSVNDVFLRTSKEAIWQIQPVGNFITNTTDARLFILPDLGPNITTNPVYLSDKLINSFEPGDKRLANWIKSVTVDGITYPYTYKYKVKAFFAPVSEYTMVLRLSEQYLIRAEARGQLGDGTGSVADLNVIRRRAGLGDYAGANDKESLLTAIIQERQSEFFTEWGHRWLDLKRTGKADEVLSPIKGTNWQSMDQLYPIPQSEINKNPSLRGHQNPGYN
jgi:hypothetical protein